MSDNWQKILKFQKETREKEERILRERERIQTEVTNKKKRELQEEYSRRQMEISFASRQIEDSINLALPILNDIQRYSTEIITAPNSEVVVLRDDPYSYGDTRVLLKWGVKLAMTPTEEEIIEKYKYKIGGIKGIVIVSRLPEQFIAEDYKYIELRIGHGSYSHPGPYLGEAGGNGTINDLLLNPNILIPIFISQLLNPSKIYHRMRKGAGYWENEPPPSIDHPYQETGCS